MHCRRENRPKMDSGKVENDCRYATIHFQLCQSPSFLLDFSINSDDPNFLASFPAYLAAFTRPAGLDLVSANL